MAYNKNEYNRQYDEQNRVQKKLLLNTKTDADILEKLNSVKNIQGYIKELIRQDIRRTNNESGTC